MSDVPTQRSLSFAGDAEFAAIVEPLGREWSGYVRETVKRAHALDLTDETAAQLREAASRDLPDVIPQALAVLDGAEQDAAFAWVYLQGQGWHANEVLAVMNAMMGTLWMPDRMPLAMQLCTEMYEAHRLGSVDLSDDGWGISVGRWRDLCDQVAQSSEEARCLLDVGRLIWRVRDSQLERTLHRLAGRG